MAEPAIASSASIASPAGEFRVGHVLSSALSILFRNIPQFGILSAIASLPYLAFLIATRGSTDPLDSVQAVGTSGYFLQLLLDLVLTAFCQSIMVFGAFQAMRERTFRTADSLRAGFGRFIPVLGTAFLSLLISGLGMLLIVPGLIATCMLYVAEPACVVERLGPTASLGRSSDLTRGYRWKIFGLLLLLGICVGIATVIVGALLGLAGSTLVLAIGTYLWETVSRAILAVVAVVAYHDLRVAKEGVDIEHIAAVFD